MYKPPQGEATSFAAAGSCGSSCEYETLLATHVLEQYIDSQAQLLKIAVLRHAELQQLLAYIEHFPRKPKIPDFPCSSSCAVLHEHDDTETPVLCQRLADTAQAQRHQPSPGHDSPSSRAVEAPSCPTSTCAASTDDLSKASPPSPATQENEAKIPIHANTSSTTATQLPNDEQPPSSNFLAPCMTILAILVGFCCLLQGLYGHFCLDGPRRQRIRSQSASQRVCKRVKFRKRRQTKVYSLANFLSLKLPPTTRTTTQQHAATTQPPVYSVSASLHGLREAHASLTYGLNYGVEEIANVWRDWRCPCGHVNFRRREECQLCSLSKITPIAEASSSCVLQ